MNCQSFEKNLTDLARQHPLEATALTDARAHAEACASCAVRLEEQRSLTSGLRSLAEEMKAFQAPGHVESRLRKAFRERDVVRQPAHATMRTWFAVAGIAAMLLITVGVVAVRLSWAPAPSPVALVTGDYKAAPEIGPDKPSSAPEVSPNPKRPNSQTRSKTAKHRVKRNVGPSSIPVSTRPSNSTMAAVEVTTGFMQLGDVSLANLQEGAQVVRVEMPRYAMARFGFPVNMERYDEKVKADVWLGADGLARAIRFVQ